jgi:predicted amidohydrolase YtcJ
MVGQRKIFIGFVAATILFTVLFIYYMPEHVDTIYVNGRFYTMDEKQSVVEAMAVKGGRIVGLGTREYVKRKFSTQHIIDLKNKTVLPGFSDAHCHFLGLGLNKLTVDLSGTNSEQDAVQRVANRVAASTASEWIRGNGWDQNVWRKKDFPTKHSLDQITSVNPIFLFRVDGHACWVNSKAMELAGITKQIADPPGGKIIRDARGEPTGVLLDAAMELIYKIIPEPSDAEMREAIHYATDECLSYGLTSVQEMEADQKQVELYKKMIQENDFPLRVYSCVDGPNELWEQLKHTGAMIGYGDHHLTVRAMKLYVDGALGSRGAALIEPYSDDPTNRGTTVISNDHLQSIVDECLDHNFQVCTHAIGDRANYMILNAYAASLQKHPNADRRLRVEHAQVLAPEDLPRFAQLGVIPSMQPTHCTSDMPWAEARLGHKRIQGAYAWRSLLKTGVVIAGGSDFPVESPSPLLGIYAACTRQDLQGLPRTSADVAQSFQLSAEGIVDSSDFNGGWYAAQRMTREEAVKAFTIWAAYAAFEENLKGSLEAGKLADFVVLSDDLFQVPVQRIPEIKIEKTYIGGHLAFPK